MRIILLPKLAYINTTTTPTPGIMDLAKMAQRAAQDAVQHVSESALRTTRDEGGGDIQNTDVVKPLVSTPKDNTSAVGKKRKFADQTPSGPSSSDSEATIEAQIQAQPLPKKLRRVSPLAAVTAAKDSRPTRQLRSWTARLDRGLTFNEFVQQYKTAKKDPRHVNVLKDMDEPHAEYVKYIIDSKYLTQTQARDLNLAELYSIPFPPADPVEYTSGGPAFAPLISGTTMHHAEALNDYLQQQEEAKKKTRAGQAVAQKDSDGSESDREAENPYPLQIWIPGKSARRQSPKKIFNKPEMRAGVPAEPIGYDTPGSGKTLDPLRKSPDWIKARHPVQKLDNSLLNLAPRKSAKRQTRPESGLKAVNEDPVEQENGQKRKGSPSINEEEDRPSKRRRSSIAPPSSDLPSEHEATSSPRTSSTQDSEPVRSSQARSLRRINRPQKPTSYAEPTHGALAAPPAKKRKAADLDKNDSQPDNVSPQSARRSSDDESDVKQEIEQLDLPSKRRKTTQTKDTSTKTKSKSTPSTSTNSKRSNTQRSATACPTCRQKKNKCNPDHIKKLKESGKHCPECKTDDECEPWHWDYYEQRKKLPKAAPAGLTIDNDDNTTSIDESPTSNSTSASTTKVRAGGHSDSTADVLEVPETP